MPETELFGSWVKARRKTLDVTQQALADQVGCSIDMIKKIEAGSARPSRQLAELLAAALGIAPEDRPAFVQWARSGPKADPAPAPAVGGAVPRPPGLVAAPPVLAGSAVPATDPLGPACLPIPLTPFVGRRREVSEVQHLLWRVGTRLVTLTGPPGVGKTRLALQVAAAMQDDVTDGVAFVSLAPITDPTLVISAIAQTVEVREGASQSLLEQLKQQIQGRRLLLILDNFEQVLPAALPLAELLQAAPGLKALVTSRERLHLYGEHEFIVPSLTLPPADALDGSLTPQAVEALVQYEAIELFVQHARAANSRFALHPANATAVVQICRRLDGLALAIELAAARVRLFTPNALLAHLATAFALLVDGPRDVPARQRTLRAAIQWSYDLLSAAEQRLLRRMAVFQGGCTVPALAAVCDVQGDLGTNVLAGLESLVNKSLVAQQDGPTGEPRFTMLEMIRVLADEQLRASGEASEIAGRHLTFFTLLAEEMDPQLRGEQLTRQVRSAGNSAADPQLGGTQLAVGLARLEIEHSNLRAALDWAGQQPRPEVRELGARLAGALGYFWFMRGYVSEGWERLTEALPHIGGDPQLRTKIYNQLGNLARIRGDYDTAHTWFTKALAIGRALDDKHKIAEALHNLGLETILRLDYDAARQLFEESLALWREMGSRHVAISCMNLGAVAYHQADYDQARVLFQEALDVATEFATPRYRGMALGYLGDVESHDGDHEAAVRHYHKGLAVFGELRHKMHIAWALEGLARVMVHAPGAPDDVNTVQRAARLWGAAEGLRVSIGTPISSIDVSEYQAAVALARQRIDDAAWTAAWIEGRMMRLEEAIAYALEETY